MTIPRSPTIYTTVTLLPIIQQSYNANLLSIPILLSERMKYIAKIYITKMKNKYGDIHKKKWRTYEKLMQEYKELYEWAKTEEEKFETEAKNKKERSELSFSSKTCRMERPTRKK